VPLFHEVVAVDGISAAIYPPVGATLRPHKHLPVVCSPKWQGPQDSGTALTHSASRGGAASDVI